MFPNLFGETPSSPPLKSYLEEVASSAEITVPEAEVKSYPDAVYFNYHALGLSLLFTLAPGYKLSTNAALEYAKLSLDSVNIFNPVKTAAPSKGKAYSRFPLLPLELFILPAQTGADSTPTHDRFELKAETTGKDIVQAFGEPNRKGGGTGPSSGSIDIWCEYKEGIMVEFGGDEARGPQAWDRGKDAVWKVITLFKPKDT